jgi:hypothetical protein
MATIKTRQFQLTFSFVDCVIITVLNLSYNKISTL